MSKYYLYILTSTYLLYQIIAVLESWANIYSKFVQLGNLMHKRISENPGVLITDCM